MAAMAFCMWLFIFLPYRIRSLGATILVAPLLVGNGHKEGGGRAKKKSSGVGQM